MTQIVTPLRAFQNLAKSLDGALIHLDDACVHFGDSVLCMSQAEAEIGDDPEAIEDFRKLVENYILMSGFLIDHPLTQTIKTIREESVLSDTDASVMAINKTFVVGQRWTHYKGTVYEIVSIGRDANHPYILIIHYTSGDGNVWSLPVNEFSKHVDFEGSKVPRFKYGE